KHRFTVIRSPHKDKDSREHFEMRIHKRLLDILEPSPKTVDSLQRMGLPAGDDMEIKIQQPYPPARSRPARRWTRRTGPTARVREQAAGSGRCAGAAGAGWRRGRGGPQPGER